MNNKHVLLAVAAAFSGLMLVPAAHAQVSDAIALTNQAIVELTDAPGLGARTTVDLNKRWGADVGQISKATTLLQEALSKASGANPAAVRLLEEAVISGKVKQHKEARLNAQGALFHLCKQAGSGEGCDKVPKFGSYVAP